ncbi:MAG: KEOPS complex subunit Pcc1 [Candidatus Bathyarchaeia archaeon]
MEAKIVLLYESERDAEAIANAVSPDNVKTPPGLTVKTFRRGSSVVTLVRCEDRFETFLATINDLLAAVQVAERTVSVGHSSL